MEAYGVTVPSTSVPTKYRSPIFCCRVDLRDDLHDGIDTQTTTDRDDKRNQSPPAPPPLKPAENATLRSIIVHFSACKRGTILGFTFVFSDDIHVTKSCEHVPPRETFSRTLMLDADEHIVKLEAYHHNDDSRSLQRIRCKTNRDRWLDADRQEFVLPTHRSLSQMKPIPIPKGEVLRWIEWCPFEKRITGVESVPLSWLSLAEEEKKPAENATLRSIIVHFSARKRGTTLGFTFVFSDDIHVTKRCKHVPPREMFSRKLMLDADEHIVKLEAYYHNDDSQSLQRIRFKTNRDRWLDADRQEFVLPTHHSLSQMKPIPIPKGEVLRWIEWCPFEKRITGVESVPLSWLSLAEEEKKILSSEYQLHASPKVDTLNELRSLKRRAEEKLLSRANALVRSNAISSKKRGLF